MTTIEFATLVSTMTVAQKQKSLSKIRQAIDSKIDPEGNPITTLSTLEALIQLSAWLQVNIVVGNELCPPSKLKTY